MRISVKTNASSFAATVYGIKTPEFYEFDLDLNLLSEWADGTPKYRDRARFAVSEALVSKGLKAVSEIS